VPAGEKTVLGARYNAAHGALCSRPLTLTLKGRLHNMQNNHNNTPAADLQVQGPIKRSLLWNIYWVLITLLSLASLPFMLAAEGAGWPEILTLVSFVIGTVGLFGYAFSKAIWNRTFWLAFAILSPLWGGLYFYVTQVDQTAGMSAQEALVVNA